MGLDQDGLGVLQAWVPSLLCSSPVPNGEPAPLCSHPPLRLHPPTPASWRCLPSRATWRQLAPCLWTSSTTTSTSSSRAAHSSHPRCCRCVRQGFDRVLGLVGVCGGRVWSGCLLSNDIEHPDRLTSRPTPTPTHLPTPPHQQAEPAGAGGQLRAAIPHPTHIHPHLYLPPTHPPPMSRACWSWWPARCQQRAAVTASLSRPSMPTPWHTSGRRRRRAAAPASATTGCSCPHEGVPAAARIRQLRQGDRGGVAAAGGLPSLFFFFFLFPRPLVP